MRATATLDCFVGIDITRLINDAIDQCHDAPKALAQRFNQSAAQIAIQTYGEYGRGIIWYKGEAEVCRQLYVTSNAPTSFWASLRPSYERNPRLIQALLEAYHPDSEAILVMTDTALLQVYLMTQGQPMTLIWTEPLD